MKSSVRIMILAVLIVVLTVTPQQAQATRAAGMGTRPAPSNPLRLGPRKAPAPDSSSASSTIYVDDSNSTGIEDGTQEHPFSAIQEGLGIAHSGDTVQVAAGTYYERITLKGGVQLVGAGAAVTLIDGKNQNDSVVSASNVGPGTLLDGFTIAHGTGKREGGYTYGGGLHSSNAILLVRNCAFVANSASDGAGGLQAINSTITIERCTFDDNRGWWGGAITIVGGNATIQNTVIDRSSGGYGGALFAGSGAQLTSVNTLIMRTSYVPAIGIGGSTATIINNTIVGNGGSGVETNSYIVGGGTEGSAVIVNSILWDNNDDLVNVTATYSDIGDGDPGAGNISTYPLFADPASGDYRLRLLSLCIDAGTNDGAPPVDLEGDPRPLDGNGDGTAIADMGMDEFSPLVVTKRAVSEAPPGYLLLYEIALDNTGAASIVGATLTDTLPSLLTYQDSSLSATGGDYGHANGVITWTGSLELGSGVTIIYGTAVSESVPVGTPLINTVVVSSEGQTIARTCTTYVGSFRAHLPLVLKPRPGIQGQVTFAGTPVQGVPLELRFWNGSSWSTAASTSTDAEGYYAFLNVPSLGPGQAYYVRYQNTAGTPQRLWAWGTRTLTSYAAGSAAHAGSFDIADINLVAPADGTTVGLPHAFHWTPRPATPSDSYEFNLFDPADLDPYFYTDPPLGYVGSYTLNALPSGFRTGRQYVWEMWVYSPDGGFGISYDVRRVTFSSAGSRSVAIEASLSAKPARQAEDLSGR